MSNSVQYCDVLIFGSFGDLETVVQHSLERAGYDTISIPFSNDPLKDVPGYQRELKKALSNVSAKILIPVGNPVTLARSLDLIPEGIRVPIDTAAKLEMLDNKVSAVSLVASLGLNQPHIYGDISEVRSFPVVFKRSNSFGGCGVYFPRDERALGNLVSSCKKGDYLIEDFVNGEDWSIDAIRWDNFFQAGCYKSLSSGKGPSERRIHAENDKLVSFAKTILDSIDFHGICGMDFKIDCHGQAYFLECNPRFTGGLQTQIESGFDIPAILCNFLA